ncbi:hypothetical protein [Ruminococcus sp.]|uniref:hypothetical protein n=1 Tax=Ruminococcus sp. TaxID=41978 RepID=UPI0025FCB0D2|nr:hypothetical protein [Ruminococcus sp.]
MEKEERHMFDIMAKPVQNVIFVREEKAEEFLQQKADAEMKKKILFRAKKIQEQMAQSENEKK